MEVEDDSTNAEGHELGGIRHGSIGRSEKGLLHPETVEAAKQSVSTGGDPEIPGTSKIRWRDNEVKSVANEGVGDKINENTEKRLVGQHQLKNEKGITEENEVLQALEGVLTKIESLNDRTVNVEREDRTAEKDVEVEFLGGEFTTRNGAVSEERDFETLHEQEKKCQVIVSRTSADEEMSELKDETANASFGKVEIKLKEDPIGGLSRLSEALSEVETGADGATVSGMGGLVAYGSSSSSSSDDDDSVDSSASSSSSSTSSDSDSDVDKFQERKVTKEAGDREEEIKNGEDEDKESDNDEEKETKTGLPPPVKAKKEVMLQDLPAVPYVEFRLADGEEINLLGKISNIIGQLVVVASNPGTPALNEDTVLFKENRHPIGVVFEIFGPVSNPFYTVRFNSTKDISDLELTLNSDIFFAPRREEITNYVFVKQLKEIKGSDASWINDNEPPVEFLDYSDDEAEKAAKKKKVLEDGKRKPARRRDDPSLQDNEPFQGIPGQQTSFNARSNHPQYSSRGGPRRGPYHSNMQRSQPRFSTRTNHTQGQRPPFSHMPYTQQGDNNWLQQQRHMFPARVPFDGQNIPPSDPNFGYNPDFPQIVLPLLPPFPNQGPRSEDGPGPWQSQPPQHFSGMPVPPAPPSMSPYSMPPPPLMSVDPLNSISALTTMVPPPPPPVPPP